MLHCYWITTQNGEHGRIVAENFDKADRILFMGILSGRFPVESFLVEELHDNATSESSMELDEEDIISID
jgi:hypothetical protein